MKKVLVVVDMQNDFITGSLGSEDAQAIVPNVVKKVQEYIDNGDFIFYTMDTHYDHNYLETEEGSNLPVKHCISGTQGWEIIPELQALIDQGEGIVIEKESFSDPKIGQRVFQKIKEHDIREEAIIEIIGLCTDICVVSNALLIKAFCPNSHIVVDAACCAGTTPKKHEMALQVMESCQIYRRDKL